jgi:predicted RNA-binding Zn-ribbon protein involved in translation (DUF1610 family)
MGVSAFFVLALTAALRIKPTTKVSPVEKLERVEKGLAAVVKASPVLDDLVQPMLKDVDAALASKDDKKMAAVLTEFPKWQQQMSERQQEITNSGDEERTSLLVAVLQNKQTLPISEQLDVLRAADFSGLPAVECADKHNDDKTPLVQFVLQCLDGDKVEPVATPAPAKEAEPASLDDIVGLLKVQQKNAETRLASLEAREKNLATTFGTDNSKEVKFIRHREERKLAKEKAVTVQGVDALKKAIVDIQNKDIKGVEEAKKALMATEEALEVSQGHFLAFLQSDAPGFACPYCGAQCIEKCRTTEHKSMSGCLTECLAKNPMPGQ